MNRHIRPTCPAAPSPSPERDGIVRESFTIELVTPMFGGGVEAGCNDPITLIRPSSIRGQLRFWWRATRGARFESLGDLRRQEGKIWGNTQRGSPVSIEIVREQVSSEDQRLWAEHRSDERSGGVRSVPTPLDRNFPVYALFPFQGETKKQGRNYTVTKMPAKATWRASFELRLVWPKLLKTSNEPNAAGQDIESDVRAALWAWVNFGGLGSRTRRGCGALYADMLSPAAQTDVGKWYVDKLHEFEISPVDLPRDWPTLPHTLLHGSGKVSPWEAWGRVLSLLQTFRQGPGIGRNQGSGTRPGRSRWPEPESIREICNRKTNRPVRPPEQKWRDENIPVDFFPRAEFGMPIIFDIRGEGLKLTLQPDLAISRMASPLILKPLSVASGQALPLVLCFNTKPVEKAILAGKEGLREAYQVSSSQIRNNELEKYPNSPLKNSSGTGSALEAFLQFARQNGFQEVGK